MPLPDPPNLDWLKKHAKRRLAELRTRNATATLAEVQLDVAREYGFASWRALKRHVDEHSTDERLFSASKSGDREALARLLDEHPEKLHIRDLTAAELLSAERGSRRANVGARDLLAALALGDWDAAERLVRDVPTLMSGAHGLLHLMAKRNDASAARWLLDHGADPNAMWAHWDADVTPLHLAVLGGHPGMVRLLLAAGAEQGIRDSKHNGDAVGWALFFRNNSQDRTPDREEVVKLLLGDVVEVPADQREPDPDAHLNAGAAPLFEEPFADATTLARNWIAAAGMTVRRGVLSFAPGAGEGFCAGITRRSDLGDFALTVDVRIVRGAIGLVLRATAPDRYYMIQFDVANDPSVVWFHTFTPAADRGYRLEGVRSRHVPPAGAWQLMRVVVHGYRFEVSLGDVSGPLRFCASWEDLERTYEQGAIGLWEHGGEAGDYRALAVLPLR